jgi:hypothetical protein
LPRRCGADHRWVDAEGDAAFDALMCAMPQLCAMSVAFEAHGEIVPKRG